MRRHTVVTANTLSLLVASDDHETFKELFPLRVVFNKHCRSLKRSCKYAQSNYLLWINKSVAEVVKYYKSLQKIIINLNFILLGKIIKINNYYILNINMQYMS